MNFLEKIGATAILKIKEQLGITPKQLLEQEFIFAAKNQNVEIYHKGFRIHADHRTTVFAYFAVNEKTMDKMPLGILEMLIEDREEIIQKITKGAEVIEQRKKEQRLKENGLFDKYLQQRRNK
jgi:hypothetical protein